MTHFKTKHQNMALPSNCSTTVPHSCFCLMQQSNPKMFKKNRAFVVLISFQWH